MAGTIKSAQQSEGIVTGATILPIKSSGLNSYASTSAFLTAKGAAVANGDAFYNTTLHMAQLYANGVWTVLDNSLNKYDATTAPTVSNDNTEGYSVGSKWIDVTNDIFYICVDASTGAAIWQKPNNILNNATTADPTVNDDSGDGYSETSIWVNQTSNVPFINVDPAAAAAIWYAIQKRTPEPSLYYHGTLQTIPNGAYTILNFDTAEKDVDSLVTAGTAGTANWFWKDPNNAWYVDIEAAMSWDSTNADVDMAMAIYINAVQTYLICRKTNKDMDANNGPISMEGGRTVYVPANQNLDIRVFQATGGNLNTAAGQLFSHVSVTPVRAG